MSEAKFTKGPWVKFYPHELPLNEGYVSVENEDGKLIYLTKTYKRTLEEDAANADLIRVAPKMYYFIENLLKNHELGEELDHLMAEILDEARGESC